MQYVVRLGIRLELEMSSNNIVRNSLCSVWFFKKNKKIKNKTIKNMLLWEKSIPIIYLFYCAEALYKITIFFERVNSK